jgi:hypothetical protein
MSRQRKREAVLRLLRGEELELVSRSLGVTAATLSGWREAFLAAGEASLATRPTNGEALEPIRQGVRRHFGAFAKDAARGLSVRHDHGSQYMSDHFQKELACLGIERSPALVRAPEGNGGAERFIRTLKENLLWVRTFDTVEQLCHALIAFREVYNRPGSSSGTASGPPPPSEPSSFHPRPGPRRLQPGISKTAGGTGRGGTTNNCAVVMHHLRANSGYEYRAEIRAPRTVVVRLAAGNRRGGMSRTRRPASMLNRMRANPRANWTMADVEFPH